MQLQYARSTALARLILGLWRFSGSARRSFFAWAPLSVLSLSLLVLVGCSQDALRRTMESMQREAPELKGLKSWVNTEKPLTLQSLRGKIVLLDFSTYSCVNCIHIMPFIKSIERRYPDVVQVVTVHSGKYANEKDDGYIRDCIDKYNVAHPVCNDADASVWESYGAKAWPTLVLINPAGKIVGECSGDSKVGILDRAMRMLVADSQETLKKTPPIRTVSRKTDSILGFPSKVLVDGDRIIISDTGHNRLVVTTLDGKIVQTIGSGRAGDKDGDFKTACFDEPGGFCLEGKKLYVADTGNGAIRAVDLQAGTVAMIARGERQGHVTTAHDGVDFDRPSDVVVQGNHLYVSMNGTHKIWELGLEDKTARVIAGSGTEGLKDGIGETAELAQPEGMCLNGDQLFFVDSESSSVRRLDLKTHKVDTLVGKGLFEYGDQDGGGKQALLQHPLGIASNNGLLYVSDSFNHKIKTVDQNTGQTATLCGCGHPGYADGDFPQMCSPTGLSVAGEKLYVADSNNHRIRIFKLSDGTMSTLKVSIK